MSFLRFSSFPSFFWVPSFSFFLIEYRMRNMCSTRSCMINKYRCYIFIYIYAHVCVCVYVDLTPIYMYSRITSVWVTYYLNYVLCTFHLHHIIYIYIYILRYCVLCVYCSYGSLSYRTVPFVFWLFISSRSLVYTYYCYLVDVANVSECPSTTGLRQPCSLTLAVWLKLVSSWINAPNGCRVR